MKKLFTFIAAIVITTCVMAQAPEKLSYQAIIRNAANNLVTNQAVGTRISILQGSASGTAVYVETQTPTTNTNGLVTIDIGTGSVVTGTFSTIDWSSGPYYIKTETDPAGGTSYSITGTSQLLSVPYALYAKTAGAVAANSIANSNLTANSVTTSKVVDGTVTSAKIFDGTIVNADISAAAAISLSKLGTSGSANSTTYLRGDGQWSVPTVSINGTPAMITNSGASPISVDFSASTTTKAFVINRGGTAGAFSCTITLPASSNYADGDMLTVCIGNNSGGAMSATVQIAGATTLYSYATSSAVNISSSAVALTGTAVSFLRFMRIDSSTWIRLQ